MFIEKEKVVPGYGRRAQNIYSARGHNQTAFSFSSSTGSSHPASKSEGGGPWIHPGGVVLGRDSTEIPKTLDEEARLCWAVIRDYPTHLPELAIALHTGMRPSGKYSLKWDRVDLRRRLVSIPKSKNGKARHIPLNTEAMAAFTELKKRRSPDGWVFVNMDDERLCGYTLA